MFKFGILDLYIIKMQVETFYECRVIRLLGGLGRVLGLKSIDRLWNLGL